MPELDMNKIRSICESHSVKKLSLFGSFVSGDFTESSDIDVLVSFDRDKIPNLFDCYFDLKENLENHWKRPVDLVVEKEFKNKYFRESVEKSKVTIYEQ